jgi:hypothetical protein
MKDRGPANLALEFPDLAIIVARSGLRRSIAAKPLLEEMMKTFVALPALALIFAVGACATKPAATPAKPAETPAPYAGQKSQGEPELLGAPKKEQGS